MRSESDPLQLFAGIKLTNGPGTHKIEVSKEITGRKGI